LVLFFKFSYLLRKTLGSLYVSPEILLTDLSRLAL
jgi:hypothetical protein